MKKQLLILFLLAGFRGASQETAGAERAIKQGNDFYRRQQYQPAKISYESALAKDPQNKIAKFNLANTDFRLSKPHDAITVFDELATKSETPADKSRAWYNKGVILSSQKRLEESIEAYKNALRQDPTDKEARENLQKALLELKKKTPPPKKENEKKKKQQQNKKQQPKMDQRDAEQKLKLLQQKEKQLQQKLQKQKRSQGGTPNDW